MSNHERDALYPKPNTGLERDYQQETDSYPDDFWIDFDLCCGEG